MWFFFALGASFFWGLTYVFDERILKQISVPTSLAIASFAVFIVAGVIAFVSGSLTKDFIQIGSSRNLFVLILIGVSTLLIAELLIGFSISGENSVLAGLIEISYPIFIALFSYLLFHEEVLNLGIIVGGFLIFTGILVVYIFSA